MAELKTHEQAIIDAYTNPDSPTCGVKSASYLSVRTVSEKAAPQIANKFFARQKIKDAIAEAQQVYAKRREVNAGSAKDRILARLHKLLAGLIVVHPDGTLSTQDHAAVVRYSELEAKIEGVASDKITVDFDMSRVLDQFSAGERPLLTDAVQDRLKRLGKASQNHTESDVIDAQFVAHDTGAAREDQPDNSQPPEFPDYA